MLLKNKTTKKIISKDLRIAKTFSDKIFGLLREKPETAMLFFTRFGIHTFLMKSSITVLVLNQQNKIVQIKENLKPNRIFLWNPKFNKIIELPNSTKPLLSTGQTLEIVLDT